MTELRDCKLEGVLETYHGMSSIMRHRGTADPEPRKGGSQRLRTSGLRQTCANSEQKSGFVSGILCWPERLYAGLNAVSLFLVSSSLCFALFFV